MNFLTIFLGLTPELPDGGPLYAETNLHFWIAEPFNAISSLAYLFPAYYWYGKIKGQVHKYLFLAICLPFLVLGGVGSTLYHAFRNSAFFLWLDVFPVAVVCLMVSIYFWIKIFPKWWYVFFILVPFIISKYISYETLNTGTFQGQPIDSQTVINISYFITGVMIFLPALILLILKKFKHALSLTASCLFFMLGLFFREIDTWYVSYMSVGTHWLWHVSTASGSLLLGAYLYNLRKNELEEA